MPTGNVEVDRKLQQSRKAYECQSLSTAWRARWLQDIPLNGLMGCLAVAFFLFGLAFRPLMQGNFGPYAVLEMLVGMLVLGGTMWLLNEAAHDAARTEISDSLRQEMLKVKLMTRCGALMDSLQLSAELKIERNRLSQRENALGLDVYSVAAKLHLEWTDMTPGRICQRMLEFWLGPTVAAMQARIRQHHEDVENFHTLLELWRVQKAFQAKNQPAWGRPK